MGDRTWSSSSSGSSFECAAAVALGAAVPLLRHAPVRVLHPDLPAGKQLRLSAMSDAWTCLSALQAFHAQ